MALGEPYAGKPPVRFDEGRRCETGTDNRVGLIRKYHPAYSTRWTMGCGRNHNDAAPSGAPASCQKVRPHGRAALSHSTFVKPPALPEVADFGMGMRGLASRECF